MNFYLQNIEMGLVKGADQSIAPLHHQPQNSIGKVVATERELIFEN
jgi:hypothetical protein